MCSNSDSFAKGLTNLERSDRAVPAKMEALFVIIDGGLLN
jgi:hypothetical protein